MKHSCRYTPTVMSGPVVRFEFGYNEGTRRAFVSGGEVIEWSGEINASRDGVSIQGRFPIWSDAEDIDAVRAMLSLAYEVHAAMRDARDPHEVAKTFVNRHNASSSALTLDPSDDKREA